MLAITALLDAPWGDLHTFFTDGNPPLVLRLLAINTIFLVLFIVRRARMKSPPQAHAAYVVQALLITANAFVIFGPEILQVPVLVRYGF